MFPLYRHVKNNVILKSVSIRVNFFKVFTRKLLNSHIYINYRWYFERNKFFFKKH